MPEVVVVGGSLAGLATALALANVGVSAAVIEPDDASLDPSTVPIDARPGVPQHANAHNFLALSRVLLRDRAPEALKAIEQAGAMTNRFERVFGEGGSGDDDLAALACRRPVFEAALRGHVLGLDKVTHVPGRVSNIEVRGGRAVAVRLTDGRLIEAGFVVDATGRRTGSRQWVEEAGVAPLEMDVRPSPVAGLALTFRLHDGADLPEGKWFLGPVAGAGYVTAIVFLGDNRTFTLLLITAAGDEEMLPLRKRDSYVRGAATLPTLRPWLERADPINEVQFMAGIRNVRHHWIRDGEPAILGVQPVGDALVHTNPQHGWGVSLAFQQAFTFADVFAAAPDQPREAARAFDADAGREASRRYEIASGFDEEFTRLREGEAIDVTDPSSYLWPAAVVQPVAINAPELAPRVIRHGHLLDPYDELRAETEYVQRVGELIGDLPPPTPPAMSREDFVALIAKS